MSYLHTGSRRSASTMSDCAYDVNIVWVTLNELKRQAAVTFIILKKEKLTHDKWNV